MTGLRTLLGLTAATLAVAALGLPPTAAAVDQSKGHPGFCTSGAGVTVVIDFQQLGGTTIVRCNPRSTRGTGLDALKGAGFQVAGVQRWGEAFICRIENRPSAVEPLPIPGNDGYKESCVDTPPAAGYWSYWHAGNNCAWDYSQWGVKNRDFEQGGFEGWSFSLNATADSNPVPRVAAVRPGTEGGQCDAVEEPPPLSDDPNEQQQAPAQQAPGGGGAAGTRAPSAPGATAAEEVPAPGGSDGGALPPPKPRPSAGVAPTAEAVPDPAANVAFTGGEDAADVDQLVKEQSGASDFAPWVAGGAVLVLGAAGWFTARRRRLARDG